jgi:hypothetical protein
MNNRLNVRQWLIASFAVFVVVSIVVFLFAKLSSYLFPPQSIPIDVSRDIAMLRVWNYLSRAIFALLFVIVFVKGYEGKSGLKEGMRFGILMGLLIYLAGFFSDLVLSQAGTDYLLFHAVEGIVTSTIAGITAGMAYVKKPAA